MAHKIAVTLIDDLNGDEASENVRFGLDGKDYEIDLNEENASALREFLSDYIDAGRRVPKNTKGRAKSPRSSGDPEAAKMRKWAQENGYAVSSRGRISAEIREAYENSK